MRGETGQINPADLARYIRNLRAVCEKFELKNIYNMDEFSLQYALINRRVLTLLEDKKIMQEQRGSKEKL